MHEQEFTEGTSRRKGFNMRNSVLTKLLAGLEEGQRAAPAVTKFKGSHHGSEPECHSHHTAFQPPHVASDTGTRDGAARVPPPCLPTENSSRTMPRPSLLLPKSNQGKHTLRILVAKETGNVVFVFPTSSVEDSTLK